MGFLQRLFNKLKPDPNTPSLTLEGGSKFWKLPNGQFHREDGPAYEGPAFAAHKGWYFQGQFHREDGPAIEWANGCKEWYRHGQRHREDGPAVEKADGRKEWWLHGQRHREDGPAIEWPSGTKLWCLNDKLLTESEFNAWREEQRQADITVFTTGLDKPLPVTHGKLKLRAPSLANISISHD